MPYLRAESVKPYVIFDRRISVQYMPYLTAESVKNSIAIFDIVLVKNIMRCLYSLEAVNRMVLSLGFSLIQTLHNQQNYTSHNKNQPEKNRTYN